MKDKFSAEEKYPVEIQVLGRKYFFSSDNPAELIANAERINSELESLNRINSTLDQSKLLIYYALLMTEKYNNEVRENKKLNKELENLGTILNDVNISFEE